MILGLILFGLGGYMYLQAIKLETIGADGLSVYNWIVGSIDMVLASLLFLGGSV